jgi:hypothetical protein
MAEFSSTQNTGNLIKYIAGIPLRGIPPKITIEHLKGLGFKSDNDRSIVTVLKGVGICDGSGVPNDNYKKMRNTEVSKKFLAQLLRSSYSDLFTLYPNADAKDEIALNNYFASKTDVGAASLRNIVGTFQALCSAADFSDGHVDSQTDAEDKRTGSGIAGNGHAAQHKSFPKTEVHFDIQIHLPGDQKPEVYESIFKNLGKYVLGNKDE